MAKNVVVKKDAKQKKQRKPGRIRKYFKEVGGELKKVTWPTKKELINYTGVVIVFVLVFAVVIGAMDWGLSSLLKLITQ